MFKLRAWPTSGLISLRQPCCLSLGRVPFHMEGNTDVVHPCAELGPQLPCGLWASHRPVLGVEGPLSSKTLFALLSLKCLYAFVFHAFLMPLLKPPFFPLSLCRLPCNPCATPASSTLRPAPTACTSCSSCLSRPPQAACEPCSSPQC